MMLNVKKISGPVNRLMELSNPELTILFYYIDLKS
jgi:hypothetical protein